MVYAVACLIIKDYDSYFNNHVPRQIYKANQSHGLEDEKAVPSNVEVSSLQKEATAHEEAPHIV